MLLLVFIQLLASAQAHRCYPKADRYQDVSSAAFHLSFEESLSMMEKGYDARRKGVYWPTCLDSPLFGRCDLKDFEVNTGRVLGAGGYGKVYLGRHKPTGKSVALKQIAHDVVNPRHVEHEEKIHHSLNHPYIAKFHCTMRDPQGNLFFAIEYIPGNNLGKRIGGARNSKLPRSTVQRYIGEIVVALEYLHAQCIVYRDLKASNILVSKSGHIKLIDFGLSVYDCDDKLRGFAGTLEYAAPEMAAYKNYGRAVDYYSLGILLFRLITGSLPISRTQVNMDKGEFLHLIATGFTFPSTGDRIADDLIAHFCNRNVAARYGVRLESHKLIRDHPFFNGFSWNSVKSGVAVDDSVDDLAASRTMVPLERLHKLQSRDDSDSY